MPQDRPAISAEIRQAVLVESGHRCAVCGAAQPLEFAHIRPWRECKKHSAEDIVCLCANCHELADRGNWTESTFRAYKQTPWVARNYANAAIPPEVEVTFRMTPKEFSEDTRAWFRLALAGLCRVRAEEIDIQTVAPPSPEHEGRPGSTAAPAILVGGRSTEQTDLVCRMLTQAHQKDPVIVHNLNDLNAKIAGDDRFECVVLFDDLPGLNRVTYKLLSSWKSQLPPAFFLIVATRKIAKQALGRLTNLDVLPASELTESRLQDALQGHISERLPVTKLQFETLPTAPTKAFDHVLRRMVHSLNRGGDIKERRDCLGALVWNVLGCGTATVRRLYKALSGVRVLLVTPAGSGNTPVVLKVVSGRRWPRVRGEIRRWNEIFRAFGTPKPVGLVLPIRPPIHPCSEGVPAVAYDGSYAVAYEYPGTSDDVVFSLREAYCGEPQDFVAYMADTPAEDFPEDAAARLLVRALRALREGLYRYGRQEKRVLWGGAEDAKAKYEAPPLLIWDREKSDVLGAIAELDDIGFRMLPEHWHADVSEIEQWFAGPAQSTGGAIPVVISAVHGDLNADNILYCASQRLPLFVDFARYRPDGSPLQDLARLEIEVKYALMDRECNTTTLPALDYASERLPNWRLLEDHLAGPGWHAHVASEPESTLPLPVVRALRITQLVRSEAWELQKAVGLKADSSAGEYQGVLLHETLHAICTQELSPLKRLLATHSAANIIKRLNDL